MSVAAVLQALAILAPLVEELVKSLANGTTPSFVNTLPDPLRSRVALNIREAAQK